MIESSQSRERGTRRALVVSLIGFGLLAGLLQFASVHGARKEPLRMEEAEAPPVVGAWRLVGAEPRGWLEDEYPIGSRVFRYAREDGRAMLVTAAVGQERYGVFSNIPPAFLRLGHEPTAKLPQEVAAPASGRRKAVRVTIYSAASGASGFAFLGLYWNGRALSTSLATVKVGVTLARAVGLPKPTAAVYFQCPMDEGTDPTEAAAEVAEFAEAFLPAVEELRGTYAGSSR